MGNGEGRVATDLQPTLLCRFYEQCYIVAACFLRYVPRHTPRIQVQRCYFCNVCIVFDNEGRAVLA